MHTVLDKLKRDHRNFRKLLDLLAAELAVSQCGDDPDLQLIIDIVYYIESYSDVAHHACEDAIYVALGERQPDNPMPVDELMAEHDALRQLTIDVQTMVTRALNDVIVDRQLLDQKLASFIEVQRAHMNREEAAIFPVVEQAMDEADWQRVAAQMPVVPDPLFGEKLEDRYRGLYERIVSDLSSSQQSR